MGSDSDFGVDFIGKYRWQGIILHMILESKTHFWPVMCIETYSKLGIGSNREILFYQIFQTRINSLITTGWRFYCS